MKLNSNLLGKMNTFHCGGLEFNSNFDSGNLGQVDSVPCMIEDYKPTSVDSSIFVKEFRLYTRPDCGGTIYENGNRTWFFFGVRGGEPKERIQFHMMNLNRQAKLYSQGMHPVMRIGIHGKWERIKDKPTYTVEEDNFVLTFIHRVPENPEISIYYAFTYPYTCADLEEYLQKLDRKHKKSGKIIDVLVSTINNDNDLKKKSQTVIALKKKSEENTTAKCDAMAKASVASDESESQSEELRKAGESDSSSNDVGPINISRTDFGDNSSNSRSSDEYVTATSSSETTSDPPSVNASSSSTSVSSPNNDCRNEIYYHRELLIYSLQGRKVDFLTITSFHGITEEREPRPENLFPDLNQERCHVFTNKKVIFLSSRVHPGETPASFVLTGFINLLLDKKSVVAAKLRSLYIFKIVPFLNPDGVYNGMYRSDTLGQNLNRVYLSPNLKTQPTIYAAKKLIRYYHYGYDKAETCESAILNIEDLYDQFNPMPRRTGIKENCSEFTTTPSFNSEITEPENFSAKDSSSSGDDIKGDNNSVETIKSNEISSSSSANQTAQTSEASLLFQDIKNPLNNNLSKPLKLASNKFNSINSKEMFRPRSAKSETISYGKTSVKKTSTKKESKLRSRSPINSLTGSQKKAPAHFYNKNISAEFQDANDNMLISDDNSNMFLYIDLHGHASKKGVFMYGNHLPNSNEAVECMLLPRLMSMNSHHFHFDACNFSERNMYLKGKRDGLSKEGSGRVAIYKAIGLIKSYTLESNYNTGKIVNVLPPKGKDVTVKSTPKTPPKYSPSIFEEVGRALGPSILDLTSSNPISRLGNSDFRTLQGLRNSLKTEIDRSFSRSHLPAKATRVKIKRMKNNYSRTCSTQIDALKENKALYDLSWDIPSGSNIASITITHSSSNPTATTSNTTHRPNSSPSATQSCESVKVGAGTAKMHAKNTKKIQIKSQNIFGKKESSSSMTKKLKVLCEASTSSGVSKFQSIKGTGDQQIQVPRKRIKVSTQSHQLPIKSASDPEGTFEETLLKVYGKSTSNLSTASSFFQTNTDISLLPEQKLKSKSDGKLKSYPTLALDSIGIDPLNIPCCSLSLKRSPKLSNSFNKSQQCSTIATTSSTTTCAATTTSTSSSDGIIKNLSRSNKNKILKKSNSLPNLSKKVTSDGTKLKKKRILKKTETTGLKRKKTRVVKNVWH